MARPLPKILLRKIEDDMRAIEICEAESIFTVFYKDQPIKIRKVQNIECPEYPGPKYLRMAFPSSGHAFRLRDKLNKMFDTQDFEVVRLDSGKTLLDSKD
jgi:hypothetical protein